MKDYLHAVQYYETDKMGITHHSNYIRWMEEARIDYRRQVGLPYEKMEEIGRRDLDGAFRRGFEG